MEGAFPFSALWVSIPVGSVIVVESALQLIWMFHVTSSEAEFPPGLVVDVLMSTARVSSADGTLVEKEPSGARVTSVEVVVNALLQYSGSVASHQSLLTSPVKAAGGSAMK